MTMARWQATICDARGRPVPGASIEVRREISGLPLESLYSDREGATPIGNPITADSQGFAAFHCAGGAFKITATSGEFNRTWRYEGIGLGQEADGPLIVDPQGDYDNEVSYAKTAIVSDQGGSWMALQPTTGNAPPTLPATSNAYWMLLAAPGGPGSDGDPTEALDALFLDQRVTTLHTAEAVGAPIFSGPDGSAIHDGFDVLTYVDDENATGLVTSTAGELRTMDDETESSGEPTLETTQNNQVTILDRSWAVDNNKTVTHVGINSATARSMSVKIARRNSGSSYDFVVVQNVSHPGGGWVDFELSSPYAVPGSGTFHAGAHHPGGVAAITLRESVDRTQFLSSDPTGDGIAPTTENNSSIMPVRVTYAVTGVTVASTPITAAEEPSTMRGIFRMRDAEGVTLNTDVFIDFSRDDGATWETATLTEKYTEPGNVRVLDTGNVDVSGQPSGSDMKWRWRTANDVSVALLGAVMWGKA